MKRLTSFLLLAFLGVGTAAWAGATPDQPNPLTDLSSQSITSLASDDVAAQLGRKLRPVERRQLRRARRLHKRHPEWSPQQAFDAVKPMNRWAIVGLIASILTPLLIMMSAVSASSLPYITSTVFFFQALFTVVLPVAILALIASAIAMHQIAASKGEASGWIIANIGFTIGATFSMLIIMLITSL